MNDNYTQVPVPGIFFLLNVKLRGPLESRAFSQSQVLLLQGFTNGLIRIGPRTFSWVCSFQVCVVIDHYLLYMIFGPYLHPSFRHLSFYHLNVAKKEFLQILCNIHMLLEAPISMPINRIGCYTRFLRTPLEVIERQVTK